MKILVCAKDPKMKADVYIDSKELEQIEKTVCFGNKITSDGKSTK